MSADQPVQIEVRRGVMRPGWYWWIALVASSLTTGIAAVVISLHAQAESERRLCGVVTAQDDVYVEAAPQTETGRRLAAAMRELRRELGCPAE